MSALAISIAVDRAAWGHYRRRRGASGEHRGDGASFAAYTVEVCETESMRLVTAIEVLSPVNKRRSHEAYHDYLRKRRDLLRSDAHLVEIDLLRGGDRPPLERPVPAALYYVTLSRAARRPYVEVWPIQLWEPLPTLPVPLRAPDPDVLLSLTRGTRDGLPARRI